MDTEDKQAWVIYGARKEVEFVHMVCPRLNLNGRLNPRKRYNRYAPDILVNGQLAELKYRATPFFLANKLYGIDPQYAVTLNYKDYESYKRFYPELDLYFWIEWHDIKRKIGFRTYQVLPMSGVWRVSFKQLDTEIQWGQIPLHSYARRRKDKKGNGKDSYVLDLRLFEKLEQKWSIPKTTLCFLDVETSGFSIANGAVMLGIGAVLSNGDEFYTLIQPTEEQWADAHPTALKNNGLTWEDLKKAPDFFNASNKFLNFLLKNRIANGYAMFIGQNPHYDLRFLKHFMEPQLRYINAPLTHVMDIRKLYLDLANWGMVEKLDYYSGHNISKALGVLEEPVPHNALDGARAVRNNYAAMDAIIKKSHKKWK